MRIESESACRLAGQTRAESEHREIITSNAEDKTELGRCAKCAKRVTAKNFGTASHGKILLLWCEKCHHENQQADLEFAEVRQ